MLKLRYVDNPGSAIWLVEPKVCLGAAAGSDLALGLAGLAGQHLEIAVQHETLSLTVLDSAVVTRVNEQVIPVGVPTPLKVDDRLSIGDLALEVIDPKKATSTPQRAAPKSRPPAKPQSGWALKANHSALANRVYPVEAQTLVGRSNDCDIVLAAAHLSRRHAQLSIRNGALFVKDLGSANGTFVNGQRISESSVKRGDELRFDTLSFGVIGPANEELDKTSIRSDISAVEAIRAAGRAGSTAPVSSPPVTEVNRGAAQSASRDAVVPGGQSSAARATPEVEVSSSSALRRFSIGAGLIIIIGAGLFIAWQQSWF